MQSRHLHGTPEIYTWVQRQRILFFQGGWGKVAAAASTQYVIDHFQPERLINLGTCGGVEGRIERFAIVAPEKVVIYDIAEAMDDSEVRSLTTQQSSSLDFPPESRARCGIEYHQVIP